MDKSNPMFHDGSFLSGNQNETLPKHPNNPFHPEKHSPEHLPEHPKKKTLQNTSQAPPKKNRKKKRPSKMSDTHQNPCVCVFCFFFFKKKRFFYVFLLLLFFGCEERRRGGVVFFWEEGEEGWKRIGRGGVLGGVLGSFFFFGTGEEERERGEEGVFWKCSSLAPFFSC